MPTFRASARSSPRELAVDDYSASSACPSRSSPPTIRTSPTSARRSRANGSRPRTSTSIMDLPNSAVALAVLAVATEKNKAVIGSGAGSSVMTGPKCSRNFVHWTYDTYELGTRPRQGVDRAGRQDLVLHHRRLRLRQGPAGQLRGGGRGGGRQGAGRGAPSAQHRRISRASCCRRRPPAPTSSPSPTPAATSTTAIKQAHEFGLAPKQKLASFVLNITNMPALGLETAAGLDDLHAVLLGLQRRHARLRQALPGAASRTR